MSTQASLFQRVSEWVASIRISHSFKPGLLRRMNAVCTTLRAPDKYRSCNPSVVLWRGKLRAVIRTVNYRINPVDYSVNFDQGTDFDTRNYILTLDRDLQPVGAIELLDDMAARALPPVVSQGFEDLRLISVNQELVALGTSVTTNRNQSDLEGSPGDVGAWRNSMSLLHIDGHKVTRRYDLSSPLNQTREKNWMPLVMNGDLYVVYSVTPLRVYSVDSKGLTLFLEAETEFDTNIFGSSQFIDWQDGFLGITHTKRNVRGRRIYDHQFLFLDRSLNGFISKSFHFTTPDTVEFCCGLARTESHAYIATSTMDSTAVIARVTIPELERFLARSLKPITRPRRSTRP